MAEKLSDIEARIGSVRQLSAVITAMRGIAAARSRDANARLGGVHAYAATVGAGIAQALALLPGASPPPSHTDPAAQLIIALCAEQGFAGGFNNPVLDKASEAVQARDAEILLVGDRGMMAAHERGMEIMNALPMASHADEVPALANRISELLLARASKGHDMRVTLIHVMPGAAQPGRVISRQLLPFDYSLFPPVSRSQSPIVTLPPPTLLARLTEEYLFAQLCEALLLSHAAENEARMRAMVAARDNVSRKLDELTGRSRLLRQEAITAEVIELASGSMN